MKKITKEMREQLAAAVEEAGSQMEFSRRSDIRHSTINKILNGKSYSVADRTWRDIALHFGSNNHIGANAKINSDNNFFANAVESYRRKLLDAVIDLDIDDTSRTKVLKLIKSLTE